VERGSSSVPETERLGICCSETGEAEAAGSVWGQVLRYKPFLGSAAVIRF